MLDGMTLEQAWRCGAGTAMLAGGVMVAAAALWASLAARDDADVADGGDDRQGKGGAEE